MYKMIKKVTAIVGALTMMIQPIRGFALSLNYEIDEQEFITISGLSEAEDMVAIQVVLPDKVPSNQSENLKEDLDNFFVVACDENGKYTWKYKLTGEPGWYTIRVNSEKNSGEIQEESFYFVKRERLQEIAEELKDTALTPSAAALKEKMLVTYQAELDLDLSQYEKVKDRTEDIFNDVFKQLAACEDIYQIKNAFYSSVLAQNINCAQTPQEVKALLEENRILLGFDLEENTTYQRMNDSGKQLFYDSMRGYDFQNCGEIQEKLAGILVRAAIAKVSSWGEVYPILSENRGEIEKAYPQFQYKRYETHEDRTEIDKQIAGNFYTLEQLGKKINELSDKDERPAGGSGGGGGGGGGGGSSRPSGSIGSFVSIVQKNEEEIEKPEEKVKEETPQTVFKDVGETHWAYTSIMKLYECGIVSGTGEGLFQPEIPVTREEFIKMLLGAFQIKLEEGNAEFSDIPSDHWSSPYVFTAKEEGIVKGYNGSFGLGENLTREDMAVLLYETCLAEDVRLTETTGKIDFPDKDAIADYALQAVEKMTKWGMVKGYEDGSLRPKNLVTRAEASKVLAFFADYMH